MNLSPRGLAFLEREEGIRLDVYPDEAGIPTVGMGHVVRPEDGLQLGDTITQAQCDAFAERDVWRVVDAINAAAAQHGVTLTQSQFDALVSLAFNIGIAGFLGSTVWHDVIVWNLDDERRAFEMWDKVMKDGHKVVSPGLLARRDREVALFLS